MVNLKLYLITVTPPVTDHTQ